MIYPERLREIYELGARLNHTAGLEAVWDAAQLEILQPEHEHHPKPVHLHVPDHRHRAHLVITKEHRP